MSSCVRLKHGTAPTATDAVWENAVADDLAQDALVARL